MASFRKMIESGQLSIDIFAGGATYSLFLQLWIVMADATRYNKAKVYSVTDCITTFNME